MSKSETLRDLPDLTHCVCVREKEIEAPTGEISILALVLSLIRYYPTLIIQHINYSTLYTIN
jgi:hypothetical protein